MPTSILMHLYILHNQLYYAYDKLMAICTSACCCCQIQWKHLVPIAPVTKSVHAGNSIKERQQLPLKLPWPLTIHKSPALTLHKARLCSSLKDNILDSLPFVHGLWPSIYMLQMSVTPASKLNDSPDKRTKATHPKDIHKFLL